jgi:hypothetical protein
VGFEGFVNRLERWHKQALIYRDSHDETAERLEGKVSLALRLKRMRRASIHHF